MKPKVPQLTALARAPLLPSDSQPSASHLGQGRHHLSGSTSHYNESGFSIAALGAQSPPTSTTLSHLAPSQFKVGDKMIIGLPDGAVELYVDGLGTKAVSEKRQRNAGASARFRLRKKERDERKDERIAALQKEVEEKDRMINTLQERIRGLEEVRTQDSCNYTDRGTPTLDTVGSPTSRPRPLPPTVEAMHTGYRGPSDSSQSLASTHPRDPTHTTDLTPPFPGYINSRLPRHQLKEQPPPLGEPHDSYMTHRVAAMAHYTTQRAAAGPFPAPSDASFGSRQSWPSNYPSPPGSRFSECALPSSDSGNHSPDFNEPGNRDPPTPAPSRAGSLADGNHLTTLQQSQKLPPIRLPASLSQPVNYTFWADREWGPPASSFGYRNNPSIWLQDNDATTRKVAPRLLPPPQPQTAIKFHEHYVPHSPAAIHSLPS